MRAQKIAAPQICKRGECAKVAAQCSCEPVWVVESWEQMARVAECEASRSNVGSAQTILQAVWCMMRRAGLQKIRKYVTSVFKQRIRKRW